MVPRVRTTASPAATVSPTGPIAISSRCATGAGELSSAPRTPTTTVEIPRKAAAMIATAVAATLATTQGSRAPKRLAEASQPVSTHTSRNAAGPVAAQPCGENGVNLVPSTRDTDSSTVTTNNRP